MNDLEREKYNLDNTCLIIFIRSLIFAVELIKYRLSILNSLFTHIFYYLLS